MTEDPTNKQLSINTVAVKVVAAMPQKQVVKDVTLANGATVRDAIEQSGIAGVFPELVIDPDKVGIFGTKASMDQKVQDGDRVEIYRPLIADPKEVRRQRAIRQAEAND